MSPSPPVAWGEADSTLVALQFQFDLGLALPAALLVFLHSLLSGGKAHKSVLRAT